MKRKAQNQFELIFIATIEKQFAYIFNDIPAGGRSQQLSDLIQFWLYPDGKPFEVSKQKRF